MSFPLHPTHFALVGCAAVVLLLAGLARSSAADAEVRDFVTYIDGKRAGDYHMTITNQEDGTVTMAGQADVSIRYLLIGYRYSYRGSEVWKGGRLLRFDSTTNDNGTQYTVAAVADTNGLRVQVNGRERLTRSDLWLTTYWRLPDASLRNQAIALLDADTGRDLTGTLQYIGPNQINVAGQVQDCAHYRLTKGTQVDLWYDVRERLVRQEWMEDRHKAVLDLAGIRR